MRTTTSAFAGSNGLVATAIWFVALGCGSSNAGAPPGQTMDASDSPPKQAGDGSASADSGHTGAEAAAHTISLKWRVARAPILTTEGLDGGGTASADAAGATSLGDGGVQGIAGVRACVYQNSAVPCVTTDGDGIFNLPGLPAVSNIALTFSKDGYVPVLLPVATPNTDMDGLSATSAPIYMPGTSDPSSLPVAVDGVNKGSVTVVAVILGPSGASNDFTGAVGAKLTLAPMTGNGPYFFDKSNSFIVPTATSMVYDGAIYFNLDPGNYEVTVEDSGYDCAPISTFFGGYGYPAPPSSVKFPILAGYVTSAVAVYCTRKTTLVSTADAN